MPPRINSYIHVSNQEEIKLYNGADEVIWQKTYAIQIDLFGIHRTTQETFSRKGMVLILKLNWVYARESFFFNDVLSQRPFFKLPCTAILIAACWDIH